MEHLPIMDQGLLDQLPEVVLAVILDHLPVLVTYQQPIALVQAHPMRISLIADAHAFKQIIPKPKLSISLSQIGTAQPVLGNVVRLTALHQSPSLIGLNQLARMNAIRTNVPKQLRCLTGRLKDAIMNAIRPNVPKQMRFLIGRRKGAIMNATSH